MLSSRYNLISRLIRAITLGFYEVFLALTSQRILVSKEEVEYLCNKLAVNIRAEYAPDIIISIREGGVLAGKLLGELILTSVAEVTVRRQIPRSRYDHFPFAVRWLISYYRQVLFLFHAPQVTHWDMKIHPDAKVLLFDDVVHSGETLNAAKNHLGKLGVHEVRTASLAYVAGHLPDYYALARGRYRFPWSADFNTRLTRRHFKR